MGWVLYHDPDRDAAIVADLSRDPLVAWQHKYYLPLVPLMNWASRRRSRRSGGDPVGGALWVGCVRLTLQYHSTFRSTRLRTASAPGLHGQTSARDDGLVAIITMGEGYHNFHHKSPATTEEWVRPLDFDPTKWIVGGLAKIGLTWDLKRVLTGSHAARPRGGAAETNSPKSSDSC